MENKYRAFYRSVGNDLPSFPERYLTGCIVGRVDLIEVLSLEEYKDTIPRKLQE